MSWNIDSEDIFDCVQKFLILIRPFESIPILHCIRGPPVSVGVSFLTFEPRTMTFPRSTNCAIRHLSPGGWLLSQSKLTYNRI